MQVFERKPRFGGRIKTVGVGGDHHEGGEGRAHWYEAGASRIGVGHARVLALAAELGCRTLPGDPRGENASAGASLAATAAELEACRRAFVAAHGPAALEDVTCSDVLRLARGPEAARRLEAAWGFRSSLREMNAHDFFRHALPQYTHRAYVTLQGGIGALVDALLRALRAPPLRDRVTLRSGARVSSVSVQAEDSGPSRSRRRGVALRVREGDGDNDHEARHEFDAVFLALPAEALAALRGAPRAYRTSLWGCVSRNRLIRCFARYDNGAPPPTASARAHAHTATHAPRWRQILYRDHDEADQLYRELRLPDAQRLLRERARAQHGDAWARFGDNATDVYYWKAGTHSWRPSLLADNHYARALQPDARAPWFVAGASLSHYQHWMEGALETAQDAYARWCRYALERLPQCRSASARRRTRRRLRRLLLRRRDDPRDARDAARDAPEHRACAAAADARWTMADVRRRRWVVLDGYVYDVSRMVAQHPGGAALLERHRGQDISEAYHRVGHSAASRAWVEGMCVGRLAA